MVTEKTVRGAIAVIVAGLVARHLGPAGFGALNAAATLATMLLPLANLTADAVVIRELVRRPDREREIIRTTLWLRAGSGAVVFAVCLGIAAATPETAEHLALVTLVGLSLVWQAAETPETWFRRHLLPAAPSLARIGAFAAATAAKLALITAGAGPAAFALAYSLEVLLYGAALAAAFRATAAGGAAPAIDANFARRLLGESTGLALGAAVAAVALKLDQILVLHWLGAEAAGTYSAACRFSEIHVFVSAALAASLYPGLAESHANSPESLRHRIERQFDLLLLAGWISGGVVTVAAMTVLPRLFGPEYAGAVPVVAVQSVSALMLYSGVLRSQFAALTGAGWTQAASAVATLMAQVALGAALIPALGINGAALSQALAAFTGGWITTALLPPLRPLLLPQTRSIAIILLPWRWPAAISLKT